MVEKTLKILYITHYGSTPKDFYCDSRTGKPKKIIGDGGSNIHIHLIDYFLSKGDEIHLSTFEKHYQYHAFFGHSPRVKFDSFWTPELLTGRYNFVIDNLYKIFILPFKAFRVKTNPDFVISATDFLPDAIYSFLLKIRDPKIIWVASYFLDAPKPWGKNNPYRNDLLRFLRGFVYWLAQRFSYWLIKKKADFVLVTSEPDVKKFVTGRRPKKRVVVVQGGVDIDEAKQYLEKKRIIPVEKRRYDACFVGRFHYQKGVLEMVDIWREVCRLRPKAKLAMIGNGPLEEEVNKKIKKYCLGKNIDLLGFQTGKPKYEIFKQSKIMVHPATYDSGGMAAAEGMAWGLPAVSFDLRSLKSYYPQGMIKTPVYNIKKFADNILRLLAERDLYQKTRLEAIDLIQGVWDWKIRSGKIYQRLFNE